MIVCTCKYALTHQCVDACVWVCICVCLCPCACACVRVRVSACICVFMCARVPVTALPCAPERRFLLKRFPSANSFKEILALRDPAPSPCNNAARGPDEAEWHTRFPQFHPRACVCSGVLRTRARSPGCFVSVWVFCACLYDLYMPVCFVHVCALCASVRYVHVNVLCLLVCISVRLCMCERTWSQTTRRRSQAPPRAHSDQPSPHSL